MPVVWEGIAVLSRWSSILYTRRKLVLVLSAVGLIVSIVLLATVAPDLSSEGFVDEDAESARVDDALEEFGRGGDSIIFLFDAEQPVSDPAVRAAIEDALLPLAGDDRLSAVLTTWNTGNPGFVSTDGMSTYAVAQIAPDADVAPDDIAPDVESAAEAAGLTVNVTGGEAIGEEIAKGVEDGLLRAETVSVPLTILIQLVVFGGLIAAGVPLLVGALAIVGAIGVTFLLSTGTFQSVFAVNIITMLGLGLGIDYSLFMVARFREEIKHRSAAEAIAVSMGTVGKAILFSGVTVIFGLAATQFFPLPALRSMGQAGMVVVALALVYGLSFLPALLSVLGPRINAIPIGMPGSRRRAAAPSEASGTESGFWHMVAEAVMRRPVAILVTVLVVLLVASIPFARLDLTPGGPEVLPEGNAVRVAAERLNTDFAGDEANPIPVIVTAEDGDALSAASIAAVRAFVAQSQAVPNVVRVESVVSDPNVPPGAWDGYAGDLATLPAPVQDAIGQTVRGDEMLVAVVTNVEGAELEDLVRDLRDLEPSGVSFEVGGNAGAAVDTVDGIAQGVVPALIFVFVGSYLILLLTFGSVFLPLKAIFMTLLSIGASLGALVLVFQDGIGERLLGFQASGEIISTTPILMFCILFGLSMDYEVLMLSRIQEEYLRTGDNRMSVAHGLEQTAKVVTGAALIMVVVFGGFMLADIVIIKSMGFGLALAVLIDATIVRGLLVPATMRLMGRWNWWAPDWLSRIVHRIGLGHAETGSPASVSAFVAD
jgi:RND superfamily putative drug exporter